MNTFQAALLFLLLAYVILRLGNERLRSLSGSYLRYVILSLSSVVFLAPFFWLVAAAFKDPDVLMEYAFLPPLPEWNAETLNLSNFRELMAPRESPTGKLYFWEHLLNTFFYAGAVTMLQVFFCSLGGYALAKYDFQGQRFVILLMLGTMLVPPILLLAPLYHLLVVLGWVDTYAALIVPSAVSAFGIFLFRQTMVGVPNEIIEAGRIDGCGEFRIYYQLVMPLVRPMTSAFCLIVFLGTWNNFIGPQVFLHTQSKLPLTVVLSQYVGIYQQEYGVFLAGTLIAIVPPAVLFLALQREFIAGLTSGAVKG